MYSYIYIHVCICIYEGAEKHDMCESLCQFITHVVKNVWENASPRTTTPFIIQFLGMSQVNVCMVVLKMCTQTEHQISNADIHENCVELYT